MKHSLPHRRSRFATAPAYDLALLGPGRRAVERTAVRFSLDESSGAAYHDARAADETAEDTETAERTRLRGPSGTVHTNPFRDEPDPVVVGAVKRFGFVGLLTVAVGTGIARWWSSLGSRNH